MGIINRINIIPEEGILEADEEKIKNIAEELVAEFGCVVEVWVEGDIEPSYIVDPPQNESQAEADRIKQEREEAVAAREFPHPTELGQQVKDSL